MLGWLTELRKAVSLLDDKVIMKAIEGNEGRAR